MRRFGNTLPGRTMACWRTAVQRSLDSDYRPDGTVEISSTSQFAGVCMMSPPASITAIAKVAEAFVADLGTRRSLISLVRRITQWQTVQWRTRCVKFWARSGIRLVSMFRQQHNGGHPKEAGRHTVLKVKYTPAEQPGTVRAPPASTTAA